jgi:phage tail sheath protein FI
MCCLPIKLGVFVQDIKIQPRSIEGVSTSTAAFLGETETGPTIPTLVTSFTDYQRLFGGYLAETSICLMRLKVFFSMVVKGVTFAGF